MIRDTILTCIVLLLLPEALVTEEVVEYVTEIHTWNYTIIHEGQKIPRPPCSAGEYITKWGCHQCGKNTYSGAGATSCTRCPSNQVSAAGSTSHEACEYPTTCPDHETHCADGQQCVLNWRRCDGVKDCKDGSDESDEICREVTSCPVGTKKCQDGTQCVSVRARCDGNSYCDDRSDEAEEFCRGYTCPLGQLKCGDGVTCLTKWKWCDGKKDCKDGSDEIAEFCQGFTCPAIKQKCDDGLQCVNKKKWCDEKVNCRDGSDESVESCQGEEGWSEREVERRQGRVVRRKKIKKDGGTGDGVDPPVRDSTTDYTGSTYTEYITSTSEVPTIPTEEQRPTCDCWTPECGYCSNMECTVKQDLHNSHQGIKVRSHLKWKKLKTVVLYDGDGQPIGKLQWSLSRIFLTGCIACQTPPAVKRARARSGHSVWGMSLKEGVLQMKIEGEVVYEQVLRGECAEIYGTAKFFAFSGMTCENTYSFVSSEMEAGKRMTADCGGSCPHGQ